MDRTSTPIVDRKPVGAYLLATSLLSIAVALFLRRILSDALGELPAAEVAFYSALFAMIADFAARRLSAEVGGAISRRSGAMLALGLCLMFAAGLSATATGALAALAAIIATFAVSIACETRAGARLAGDPSDPLSRRTADHNEEPIASPMDVGEANSDTAELSQSFTRRMIEGHVVIEGFLAFDMPPGQTHRVLHVPFWPPLPATPIAECEVDGLEARVRVPLAAAHGLRVEVRAADADDETRQGELHFSAHAQATQAAA